MTQPASHRAIAGLWRGRNLLASVLLLACESAPPQVVPKQESDAPVAAATGAVGAYALRHGRYAKADRPADPQPGVDEQSSGAPLEGSPKPRARPPALDRLTPSGRQEDETLSL